MTQPDSCDWFDLIFVPMSKVTAKKGSLRMRHRPDFCADRTIRLVQKSYTLLIYQREGEFKAVTGFASEQHRGVLNTISCCRL